MTYNFVIAIPSYKRAEKCGEKTLTTLSKMGIPKSLITVFVVAEDLDEYKKTLNPDHYDKLVVGEIGIIQQRRFITQYYPEGQYVVSVDDDITEIDLSLLEEPTSLLDFINNAFVDCTKHGSYIWGVYPVYNTFFREKLKKDLSTELAFIIGSFYGFINRPNNPALETENRIVVKGDVLTSILYYILDGVVLRYNRVATKQNFYSVGGLGGLTQRIEYSQNAAKWINDRYPEFTRINVRKNGLHEIKLIPERAKLFIVPKNENVEEPPSRPQYLNNLSMDCLEKVYELIKKIKVPIIIPPRGRGCVFGRHRSVVLGYVLPRFYRKEQIKQLSYYSRKKPHIYQAVLELGQAICPFEFEAIQLNCNVVCPPHKDPGNVGDSVIVSFGDYSGGELNIDDFGTYDTNCRPLLFNGAKYTHWNNPITDGTKYSLVFFKRV